MCIYIIIISTYKYPYLNGNLDWGPQRKPGPRVGGSGGSEKGTNLEGLVEVVF